MSGTNEVEGGALLVNKKTLMKLLDVSCSTFHRVFYHAAGFPQPVIRRGRVLLWRLADIQRWITEDNCGGKL